ncbi:MAG: hypothetical protein FJZ94_08635, partial [Chloroflexi bacterium]|nr:hypothetical protein [Chloroflexota bacterium]
QADSLGSKYVAIIGDDEVKSGLVTLRDMGTGEQRSVAMEELIKEIFGVSLRGTE